MPSQLSRMPVFACLCLALSMSIVGVNIGIGKLIILEVPVFLFSALRFLIATAILLPGMSFPALRRGLDTSSWRGLSLQSFFGCFLFSLFMLYGVKYTTATSAGIITSALPSFIALLAWLWLKETFSRRGLAAMVLAMSGIALLNLQDASASGRDSLLGNGLILAAVLSEALFAVFSRRLSLTVHPWSMAFAVNIVGFLLFLPLAVSQALSFDWGAVSVSIWCWVLLYSVTASVLSFLLWYRGVSHIPASIAGLFTGLIPVAAALGGFFVLNETLSIGHILGMGLVIASLLLGTRVRSA